MDVFGFKNQGANYDKFRPRYPPSLLESSFTKIKGRGRYLDVAMGTGQLLFALASPFKFSHGMDLSSTMIDSSQAPLATFQKAHPQVNISISLGDVMDLKEEQPYDFITVGQALHFFPIKDSLIKMRSLLAKEGAFMTYAYIFKDVTSSNPKQNEYFYDFYNKVKPLFTFDRDELHNFYSDPKRYPFQEVFERVERDVVEEDLKMTKEHYLSYLKTMSGYNLYLKKNEDDPLEKLAAICAEEVSMRMCYFRVTCYPHK